MDAQRYQQAFLDLQAHLVDRCRDERYAVLNELMEAYSHCLTRADRLEFIQVNRERFAFRLAAQPAPIEYDTRQQFGEAHLAYVRARRKRLTDGWYRLEPDHIQAFVSRTAWQAALQWLEDRRRLNGDKARPTLLDESDQPPTITIRPAELIPKLSNALGQWLTPATRSYLPLALENSPPFHPLVILGQPSRFVDAFAQLAQVGIVQENKQQIRHWLVSRFLQQRGDRVETLKESSVWDYLTKTAKRPAMPIPILQLIDWRAPQ